MPIIDPFDQPQARQQARGIVDPFDQQPQQAAPSPTDGMGTLDRLMAGVGQGMTAGAQGLEQLMANTPMLAGAVNPAMGALYGQNPQIAQMTNARADENARIDAPLLETGAGMTGSVIGNMALTAPAGAGAGGVIKGVGALPKLGRAILGGMEAGAAGGAIQPVAGAGERSLSDLVTGAKPVDFADEKLKQVGIGAGVGGLGGGLLNRAGAALEHMLPSNATASVLNAFNAGANKSGFAKESEALARQTGVTLTPGQVSGSKTQTMAENAARQSIFSRDIAFEGDRKRVQQLSDYLGRTLDGITKSNSSPAVAGAQVQGAIKRTVEGLEGVRSKQAARDFGELRKVTQGSLKVEPNNLRAELSEMLTQHGDMGTAQSDALARFAKTQLSGGANSGDLDKLLMLRQHLSKVSGGQAKISGDNQDRMIAARMLQAIDDDLEQNAAQMPGDVGALLKKANSNYRAMSQQIDSVKSGPLKSLLGDDLAGAFEAGAYNTIAPEKVMERLAGMKPTELGVVRGILEKQQPEAWAVMKRGLLEDAIEKAKAFPASDGADTAVLRPNVLVKNMGDAKRLEAVFDPNELSQINAAIGVARRLSDKTGYGFSGTPGQTEVLNLMNRVTDLSAKGAASAGGAALGSRALARLMTNSDGRAALLELQRLPPQSERFRQLSAKVAALLATKTDGEPSNGG